MLRKSEEFHLGGSVCVVRLARPEKRNAMDQEMAQGLVEVFRRLQSDDKVVVEASVSLESVLSCSC